MLASDIEAAAHSRADVTGELNSPVHKAPAVSRPAGASVASSADRPGAYPLKYGDKIKLFTKTQYHSPAVACRAAVLCFVCVLVCLFFLVLSSRAFEIGTLSYCVVCKLFGFFFSFVYFLVLARYHLPQEEGGYVGTYDKHELAAIGPLQEKFTVSVFTLCSAGQAANGDVVRYGSALVLEDEDGQIWNNKETGAWAWA